MKKLSCTLAVLCLAFNFSIYANEIYSQEQQSSIDAITHDYLTEHPEVLLQKDVQKLSDKVKNTFNEDEVKAIEEIVHAYIVNNPNVLLEAQHALELKYVQYMESQTQKVADFFLNDNNTPLKGDVKATRYVIEFFDYNCGYCKIARAFTERYAKEYGAKVAYIEYPILSQISAKAAMVGLALHRINKDAYFAYQSDLMSQKGKLSSEDQIKQAVVKTKIKWEDVKAEIEKGEIAQIIKNNFTLGQSIGVRGTPYFIINGNTIRGAIDSYEDLLEVLGESKKESATTSKAESNKGVGPSLEKSNKD